MDIQLSKFRIRRYPSLRYPSPALAVSGKRVAQRGLGGGQALVKTWRVRNSGTSTWDGYKLIFLQGDQMGRYQPG
jgi:hypothetical protein